MVKKKSQLVYYHLPVLLICFLVINLPLVSALQISNIQTTQVTEDSALITWDTDEPADGFISSGSQKEDFATVGDSLLVTEHQFPLTELNSETTYYYKVESNEIIDDNNGELYSFTTLAPDLDPPSITVELPQLVAGSRLDLSGETEAGAEVKIFVNGNLAESTVAETPSGIFSFTNLLLEANQENQIKIEARDRADNVATFEGTVFPDVNKPVLSLQEVPSLTLENSVELQGNFSEEVTYEILLNNDSVSSGEGQSLSETISLDEGDNKIQILFKDIAGWETSQKLSLYSDTAHPTINFEIEKGHNYYEGRATSNIQGETKPHSKVYLFVYRQLGYEYNPRFDDPWEIVTADAEGNFFIKDVSFQRQPLNLDISAPKEVPAGLQEISIFPIREIAQQEEKTINVYVIAEDRSGRSAYDTKTVTINRCTSAAGANAFAIDNLVKYQGPMYLNPSLLDSGRQVISAWFNFSYRGQGVAQHDLLSGTVVPGQEAFQITTVRFDKACTQGMLDDESFALGCNLLPRQPRPISNGDKTSHYLTFNLNSAEKLSDKEESYWNEFNKRQVVFPLKVTLTYQERLGGGEWSEPKTQTSCSELTYFVDIPIDSSELVPDFLADEGVDAIDFTIDTIEEVEPYLEKTILITGWSCMVSFLAKTVMKWMRIFVSKIEAAFSIGEDGCPLVQNNLYLSGTVEEILQLPDADRPVELRGKSSLGEESVKALLLENKCPSTAGMWDLETALDQAMRWTCDRVYCRTVPAGWTEGKEKSAVDTVILLQQQCTATSRGIPLRKIENCQDSISDDVSTTISLSETAKKLIKSGEFPCYSNTQNGQLYYIDPKELRIDPTEPEIVKLTWISPIAVEYSDISNLDTGDLIGYKPPNSDQLLVGVDYPCATICKKSGFQADLENSVPNAIKGKASQSRGCYKESIDDLSGDVILKSKSGDTVRGAKVSLWYTSDCFVNVNNDGTPVTPQSGETGLLQCVCETDQQEERTRGARTAGEEEEWSYRQEKLFEQSKGTKGTYYPEWRYHSDRDLSAAFGADVLTDYLHEDTDKQFHQVSPSTHLGAFQTVCLSGIWARLQALKSILVALKDCINKAKTSSINDAGVCKTLFTQAVCGLVYKGISAFNSGCSPYTAEKSEGVAGELESFKIGSEAFFGSIDESMQSSINEITTLYDNSELDSFFGGGAKQFTQSICLVAFGYDWPLGSDFIMDSAYAIPAESIPQVFPATRELSTYNPAKGSAIFNYEIGALVLPGCKIKTAEVYMKCIGREDLAHPGIDPSCAGAGCDCLNIQSSNPNPSSERVKYLDVGRQFDLQQHKLFEFPIESPIPIDSVYRYDHVVVDLQLDQFEEDHRAACLPEGNRDGKFYFPIKDISRPGVGCQVMSDGRYYCAEISAAFAGDAGTYLESPYISCWDKDEQTWTSCDTPNLFTKGDSIRVKAHLNSDGSGKCLKMSVRGLASGTLSSDELEYFPKKIPQTVQGPFSPTFELGTVKSELFSGVIGQVALVRGQSDQGCSQPQWEMTGSSSTTTESQLFRLKYKKNGDKYQIELSPSSEIFVNLPFKVSGNYLANNNGETLLSSEEIKSVQLTIDNFKVNNLLGTPAGNEGVCTYQTVPQNVQQYQQDQKSVRVSFEILQPDVDGFCDNAKTLVNKNSFGENRYEENIIIQLEPLVTQVASRMHQEFLEGNCNFVLDSARSILNREQADLEDASALYYSLACYAQKGQTEWATKYHGQVCNLLDLFTNRKTATGRELQNYPPAVTNSGEYAKVEKYLSEVANKAQCSGLSTETSSTNAPDPSATGDSTTALSAATTCGHPQAQFNIAAYGADWKPSAWSNYVCRVPSGTNLLSSNALPGTPPSAAQCWAREIYSTADLASSLGVTHGCLNSLYCCPPE